MRHTGLLFAGATCLVIGILLQFGGGEKELQAKAVPVNEYDDIFNAELEKNLDRNHESIMSALDAQSATLARIEDELTAEEAQQEVVSALDPEPALSAPVRMSTTRWSVGGSWNPSKDQLISHLEGHGLSVNEGYTLEELHVMHDNVHNGYSSMGGTVVSSSAGGWGRSKTVTRTFNSSRGGLFNGRLLRGRSYSSCAGGSCR
jgi:hypothetical protein